MERTVRYLLAMGCGALPALAAYGLALPLRRRRLAKRRLRSPARREGALALFWMFCGGMAVLTLTPRWVARSLADCLTGSGWNAAAQPFFQRGTVSITPFQTFRFDPYILAGNMVVFLPFGFFAALLWRRCTWRRALALGLLLTGAVECWQPAVGRAFDVDDIMLNTAGTLCGFCLWRLLRRLAPGFTEGFHVQEDEETR